MALLPLDMPAAVLTASPFAPLYGDPSFIDFCI